MTELITTLSIVFVAAGVFLLAANYVSLSPVPAYILAGLAIAAGGFVEQAALIELAQWGIAFLVFVFGFRVDFDSLRTVIRDSEVAAVTQLLVVAPIAFGVALLFGFDQLNAVYFAAAATLSSTLVGAGLLEHDVRNNLVHGRLASSLHFFDDLVAVGLVLVLSADQYTTTLVTSKIGFGVLFLAAALLVNRHAFPLLVRLAEGFDELVMMGSISILIAFLAAAELAGISIVVGAFAAGIAIRSGDASTLGVLNGIESIKDFFVAIFFVTVGALVAVPSPEVIVVAATLVGLVAVVNPIVLVLAFGYEGYDARTAFLASTTLNQVSELSLVIAIQALLLASISTVLFEAIILAAAVTMILAVPTRRHEEAIYRRVVEPIVAGPQSRTVDERSHVADDLADHVVIVGYGRHGSRLVATCEDLDREYVVVDNDPVRWDDLQRECRNYVLGDAMNEHTWTTAGVADASLIVSTVDHRPVSDRILELETDADVVLRADTAEEADELLEAGATYVTVPNLLAGDRLVEIVDGLRTGELSHAELTAEHVALLDDLERYGFGTRVDVE